MSDMAKALLASAQRLGINPVDLATVISYETAGTFDPWKAGPTTKWGQHRGLIQWGEPQRAKYGVRQGMPVAAQLQAAERYLKDAGVRPGTGLLDLYSAINAGSVGRHNASDAAAGGAPGTVADKVNNQMAGHRKNAERLFAGQAMPAPAVSTLATGNQPSSGNANVARSFGDIVAPPEMPAVAAGPDYGNILASFMQSRARRDDRADADKARKQALIGGGGLADLYS
jgi:hypothetical protein